MAQTQNAITFANCKVEISTDGSTWTDISGFATSVSLSGGDRQTGTAFTFDGDTAIVKGGKREPLEVEVNIVYTEGVSDPFETVRAAYEAGSALYVRWSPKGGASGDFLFTSDAGIVTNPIYPTGEAGSGDPAAVSFTLLTPKVTKSTVV